ncbi:MAG: hypothetical protein SOR74_04185 [Candidatus Faecivicinus sp.]|nr:hypothetical protein [Candidatus Faecivicinus sp.]
MNRFAIEEYVVGVVYVAAEKSIFAGSRRIQIVGYSRSTEVESGISTGIPHENGCTKKNDHEESEKALHIVSPPKLLVEL